MAKRAALACTGPGNLYQKYNRWMTKIHPEVVLFVKLSTRSTKLEDIESTRRAEFVRRFKGAEIRFIPHRQTGKQKSLSVWEEDKAKWNLLAAGSTKKEKVRSPDDPRMLTYLVTYWYSSDPKAFSKLLKAREKERYRKITDEFEHIKPRSKRKMPWDGPVLELDF